MMILNQLFIRNQIKELLILIMQVFVNAATNNYSEVIDAIFVGSNVVRNVW